MDEQTPILKICCSIRSSGAFVCQTTLCCTVTTTSLAFFYFSDSASRWSSFISEPLYAHSCSFSGICCESSTSVDLAADTTSLFTAECRLLLFSPEASNGKLKSPTMCHNNEDYRPNSPILIFPALNIQNWIKVELRGWMHKGNHKRQDFRG